MDASSAADRFQLSLSSTLFIARCSLELLRFRDADGIASMLAGGTLVEALIEGGSSRDMVALIHASRFENRYTSMRRQCGKQAKCALDLLHANS